MTDEHDTDDLGAHERELFARLPRESAPGPASTDQLVAVLRREGFFHRRARRANWALQLAAAVALFASGAVAGARFATRSSLERALARTDLTVPDRILLLQRAGSAYVTAAHGYADATAHADSTAVEVANQVLRGAAHAVMKSNLNSTLSASLVAVLQTQPSHSNASKPILWY
jgi:hypothetical protein